MTTTQREQLERAIERAMERVIEVVGHGRRKADNARIYCTTSHSDPLRWHIVTVVGSRLVCDCWSRVVCSHRAAVHMHLTVQAAERELRAEEIERELAGETSENDRREAESLERLHDATRRLEAIQRDMDRHDAEQAKRERALPSCRADNRPFSIFASEGVRPRSGAVSA
jgi:hypothetical protein